ncbi:ORF_47 [Adoxophyes orana granulovirus]|uniref:ORF_47 n=1 Tax=Adoxophyes orana granulovirus TaxID=170617 RepID=Q7T9W8_GVAO|nr:ORF_47 [Adoxophyes orana granulovirus]AAP85684.1 ORF_47 [Adoxophyes orana granulovirus]
MNNFSPINNFDQLDVLLRENEAIIKHFIMFLINVTLLIITCAFIYSLHYYFVQQNFNQPPSVRSSYYKRMNQNLF